MARKKTKSVNKSKHMEKLSKSFWIGAILVTLFVIFSAITQEVPQEEQDTDRMVALVNGENVYYSAIQNEKLNLPEQLASQLTEAQVLSQVVDKKLLEQVAANTDITTDMEKILEVNGYTSEELESVLAQQGVSIEEFRQQIRVVKFLNQTLFGSIEVTDEELEDYYSLNSQIFQTQEGVIARHILVSSQERTLEEARTIMDEVETKFNENPDSFCDLVLEYSEDPGSLETCGTYGPFDRNANFVEPFKTAAFENEVGQASVAETQFGLHLIQTTEKVAPRQVTLEEIADDLRAGLLREKQNAAFADYMSQLRQSASIITCLEDSKLCLQETEAVESDDAAEETLTGAEDTNLDSFAQCLSEKNAKMFGAYWCGHCQSQKELFGESFKFINYIECAIEDNPRAQTQACLDEEISGYPTWEINGQKYPGTLTLNELARLSGCSIE